jgi:hypothetical protein
MSSVWQEPCAVGAASLIARSMESSTHMKYILVAALVCIAIHFEPGYAQAQAISPLSLVGRWSSSEQRADGTVVKTDLTLTQTLRFSGTATVQGKEFWSYSGSWEVTDGRLIWHYENSSRPLLESARTDIDDIISVDSRKLVLASHLSGKRHVYLRSR